MTEEFKMEENPIGRLMNTTMETTMWSGILPTLSLGNRTSRR